MPNTSVLTNPSVLTIAGSDSCGGAGIQADLKTILAHKCHGTTAITALTAQNFSGVQAVYSTPPDFIAKQISSILDDIETHAIKTGMLFDAENVHVVVNALRTHYADVPLPPIICDPVCVAASGDSLLKPDAIETLIGELFPLAKLITPNKAEAELLLKHRNLPYQITSLKELVDASGALLRLGSQAVLLKGGLLKVSMRDVAELSKLHPELTIVTHGLLSANMEILQIGRSDDPASNLVVDVLHDVNGQTTLFIRPRINTASVHGTGCTLSAAIASNFACGLPLVEAVQKAILYTYLAIQTADSTQNRPTPLNHSHDLVSRVLPLATDITRYPLTQKLIEGNASVWKEYVQHKFVRLLGEGTLPRKAFIHFLIQDYKYLRYYARAYALFAAKSTSYKDIGDATDNILGIVKEARSFYATYDITEEMLENTPETLATTAYGAYLIDVGLQGDNTKLLMTLLACLLGYGEVGLWLKREASLPDSWVVVDGNPYKRWMDVYGGKAYQQSLKLGLKIIETRTAQDPASESRFAEWKQVWEQCTLFEKGFWDSALAAA